MRFGDSLMDDYVDEQEEYWENRMAQERRCDHCYKLCGTGHDKDCRYYDENDE
jgi:hypothetical protein